MGLASANIQHPTYSIERPGDGTVNLVNQQSSTLRTFTIGGNGAGGGNMANFTGAINIGTNNGDLRLNDGGGTAGDEQGAIKG